MSTIKLRLGLILLLPIPLALQQVQAAAFQDYLNSAKKEVSQIFNPQQSASNKISIQALSSFQLQQPQQRETLPVVTGSRAMTGAPAASVLNGQPSGRMEVSLIDAIHQALQQHPNIAQNIASMDMRLELKIKSVQNLQAPLFHKSVNWKVCGN